MSRMDTALVRGLASYHRWANAVMADHVAQLPPEQLPVDRGLSFTSILGTLNHILVADRIWMARFEGLPSPGLALDQILYADPAAFAMERAAYDDHIAGFFDGVDAAWLGTPLRYGRAGSTEVRKRPHWVLAVHVFNHATYHRGQIAAVMNQLGHWPPESDFPAAPYFADAPAALLVPR
jgi:uncharacterized damage-inducible protein DinB